MHTVDLSSLDRNLSALSAGLNNTDGLKTAKFNMPLLLIVLEGKKRVSIFPETASVLLDPMRDGSRRMGSTNAPKEYNENDTTRFVDILERLLVVPSTNSCLVRF